MRTERLKVVFLSALMIASLLAPILALASTAEAQGAWTGTAVFRLENIWAVRIEKNLYLENGSKLVVKFYSWGSVFQDESVIENFSPPWHVEENEIVPHPRGNPVENARLVLTTDNTENVTSTIASFTVTKSTLIGRISAIKGRWAWVPIPLRGILVSEKSVIKGQWPFAPS